MIGTVDVGGGMRGIYGAGVYDYCMDHGISFDVCVGVSAGAANLCSYLAGQRGRNYRFYTEYAFRKEYMSGWNYLKSRSYLDLDYIYGTLSNAGGESPLDYAAMLRSGKQFQIVATHAKTGMPVYFRMEDMQQDRYDAVKASCCVPIVNRPYRIGGEDYFDGGLSDPIPVNRLFQAGCKKAVVVLTRPEEEYRSPKNDRRFAKILAAAYPNIARRLSGRADLYNRQLDLLKRYREKGRVLIIAPKDIGGMRTLNRDRAAMERMYHEGYEDAGKIAEFLRQDAPRRQA